MPIPKRWQLQEAKAKFSEVFDRALTQGPQYVTRRRKHTVVIVPEEQYAKLTHSRKGASLVEVLRSAPYPLAKLDLRRSRDTGRPAPDFSE